MENFEFILDGVKVSAAPGETILDVARRSGLEIPTLCHDPRVSKNTSCLVCVVRDVKTGRFIPSCTACPAPAQEIDASSAAVQEMRKTALELLLSEHSGDCEAPCTLACPAHARVEEYVHAGKNGNFLEALQIVKERIPLPMSIGRVCPRFCEKDCRKNLFGAAVNINDFKRLAADLYYDTYMEKLPELGREKVALVGAGPAGLAAAYFLRLQGIQVTVFDQMSEAGGMLRYGIPEYRLPKHAVLNREIAHFIKMGIKFEFGQRLGDNLSLAMLTGNFDAVGITIGCWAPSSMRCPGEELAVQGIDFLRQVALNGWSGELKGRVIVVGGGNTAMDCLRTAVRLGAEDIECFYRRSEAEMPAEKLEIREAREEGVHFHFLVAPTGLRRDGGRYILTCQRMVLGEPDASGRRKPFPEPGSEFEIDADMVIAAIGQGTAAPKSLKVNKWGFLDADPLNCRVDGKIFAAGDCVSGAATVVEAVAMARKMSEGMLQYLRGVPMVQDNPVNVSRGYWRGMATDEVVLLRRDISNADRVPLNLISIEERKHTFKEVSLTVAPEAMRKEGLRCIECSCTAKHECDLRECARCAEAKTDAIKGERVKVDYDNRHPAILQDRGKCIKCGICVKTCKDIVNQSLLGVKRRGFFTYISPAFDRELPLSCSDCGACVEACPVGALAWKHKK